MKFLIEEFYPPWSTRREAVKKEIEKERARAEAHKAKRQKILDLEKDLKNIRSQIESLKNS